MIAKLIGQTPEYYMLYEILRKLELITRVAPHIGWNNGGTPIPPTTTTTTTAFVFDSDYQAVLNRATALGYTKPSAGQQLKQNTFVLALKAANIWTTLDVLYVYATDGNSDYATLNWISPSIRQCTKVNSPTFTTNQGFTGNGSTSYLNTTVSPSAGTHFTLNEAGVGIYINTNLANVTIDYGASSGGTSQTYASSRTAGNLIVSAINMSGGLNPSNSNSQGFFHTKRTSSTAMQAYRNGASLGTASVASGSRSGQPFYVCGLNLSGALNSPTTRQIGMFWFGASQTTKEVSFYNAWNTYFTSL